MILIRFFTRIIWGGEKEFRILITIWARRIEVFTRFYTLVIVFLILIISIIIIHVFFFVNLSGLIKSFVLLWLVLWWKIHIGNVGVLLLGFLHGWSLWNIYKKIIRSVVFREIFNFFFLLLIKIFYFIVTSIEFIKFNNVNKWKIKI